MQFPLDEPFDFLPREDDIDIHRVNNVIEPNDALNPVLPAGINNKSSLLNRLIGQERSIVTATPAALSTPPLLACQESRWAPIMTISGFLSVPGISAMVL